MPHYLISRTIPGTINLDDPEVKQAIAKKSCEVIEDMTASGTPYEWHGTARTGEHTLVCHHEADTEQAVRDHSAAGGFPIDSIVEGDQLPGDVFLSPGHSAGPAKTT